MKGSQVRHPEDEQLFRYVDGELPGRSARQIRSHLEACWECRVELAELQDTVAECVRYRKNVLQRQLPSPPAPWIDIYQAFAKIDASAEPAFFSRVRSQAEACATSLRRWAPAVVALAVLCVIFLRFRQTPSVQAAELLRKAVAAADARSERPRKIQVRTKARRLTRLAGSKTQAKLSAADSDALNSLQALFRAANYDWDDPLSAKSYQSWRDQLADKRDEVSEEPDSYRIRTNTGSGELMQATLKLTTQELRPVEGRFEFRNQEWVEITEVPGDLPLAEAITPPESRPAARHTPVQPVPVPGGVLLPPANSSATIGDELHVWAALHQAGADLGDPIEVSRSGGQIVVAGVGIAPQRQQEIAGVLGSMPHVAIRFSDSAPVKVQPERERRADSSISSDVLQLQARIAGQMGGRVFFDQLASQVLDMSEPMMSRAYALRRLAERFSADVESELTPEDRELLRSLKEEHTTALRQQTAEMERALRPALASVSNPVDVPGETAPSFPTWQAATEDLFQSARRLERLLAVMFGVTPGEASNAQLPSQLLANVAQLRARLDAYDRLSIPGRRERR